MSHDCGLYAGSWFNWPYIWSGWFFCWSSRKNRGSFCIWTLADEAAQSSGSQVRNHLYSRWPSISRRSKLSATMFILMAWSCFSPKMKLSDIGNHMICWWCFTIMFNNDKAFVQVLKSYDEQKHITMISLYWVMKRVLEEHNNKKE